MTPMLYTLLDSEGEINRNLPITRTGAMAVLSSTSGGWSVPLYGKAAPGDILLWFDGGDDGVRCTPMFYVVSSDFRGVKVVPLISMALHHLVPDDATLREWWSDVIEHRAGAA